MGQRREGRFLICTTKTGSLDNPESSAGGWRKGVYAIGLSGNVVSPNQGKS